MKVEPWQWAAKVPVRSYSLVLQGSPAHGHQTEHREHPRNHYDTLFQLITAQGHHVVQLGGLFCR